MDFKTSGVCSSAIHIETGEQEGKKILKSVTFQGGCDGNLSGISKLVQGMEIDEVIQKLEGTRCGRKNTSCPDQLARALKSL